MLSMLPSSKRICLANVNALDLERFRERNCVDIASSAGPKERSMNARSKVTALRCHGATVQKYIDCSKT